MAGFLFVVVLEMEERLMLKIASDIELLCRAHSDLNNPTSEKFWLNKFVSKEPQFYEKLLQELRDSRRYIALEKLIEVYELDKKQCIAHDKLFRMDYKKVYEFLIQYQRDLKSNGKEKFAVNTDLPKQPEEPIVDAILKNASQVKLKMGHNLQRKKKARELLNLLTQKKYTTTIGYIEKILSQYGYYGNSRKMD